MGCACAVEQNSGTILADIYLEAPPQAGLGLRIGLKDDRALVSLGTSLMAKTNKLYVSASNPDAGSSIITLGVLGALKRRVDRIGFFKPVVRGAGNTDAVLGNCL